jgi:hypothetical protein
MTDSTVLKDYESRALNVLRKELGEFVEKVEVKEDLDHTGDDALFFEAHLNKDAPGDLGSAFITAHLWLRRELERQGEGRFPYLQTRRAAGDKQATDFALKSQSGSLAKRRHA